MLTFSCTRDFMNCLMEDLCIPTTQMGTRELKSNSLATLCVHSTCNTVRKRCWDSVTPGCSFSPYSQPLIFKSLYWHKMEFIQKQRRKLPGETEVDFSASPGVIWLCLRCDSGTISSFKTVSEIRRHKNHFEDHSSSSRCNCFLPCTPMAELL